MDADLEQAIMLSLIERGITDEAVIKEHIENYIQELNNINPGNNSSEIMNYAISKFNDFMFKSYRLSRLQQFVLNSLPTSLFNNNDFREMVARVIVYIAKRNNGIALVPDDLIDDPKLSSIGSFYGHRTWEIKQ